MTPQNHSACFVNLCIMHVCMLKKREKSLASTLHLLLPLMLSSSSWQYTKKYTYGNFYSISQLNYHSAPLSSSTFVANFEVISTCILSLISSLCISLLTFPPLPFSVIVTPGLLLFLIFTYVAPFGHSRMADAGASTFLPENEPHTRRLQWCCNEILD